jgi:hypothetical protein
MTVTSAKKLPGGLFLLLGTYEHLPLTTLLILPQILQHLYFFTLLGLYGVVVILQSTRNLIKGSLHVPMSPELFPYRGVIHQCSRIIFHPDSKRDSQLSKNRFLNLRIHF